MKPTWQQVIDSTPVPERERFYIRVLRTRRRAIPISLNGTTQYVARALVRDYLEGKG